MIGIRQAACLIPRRLRALAARCLPQTLLARTFALIAGTILLAATALQLAFRFYQAEPRAAQAARMIVSTVNLTRTALITAKPDLLRELLSDFVDLEGIRIYPAEGGEQLAPLPKDRFTALLADQVRAALGPQTRFGSEREGMAGLWVSFTIQADEYWAMFPEERLNASAGQRWLGWGAGALGLALLAAYAIVYRIRGPLSRLTFAAQEVGLGQHPVPLPEEGPAELRALASAFNHMSQGLAQLEDERALILAGVSHDLRTPLTRLRLSIEMSTLGQSMREDMVRDVEDMDRIIGQFLDFARAIAGETRSEQCVSDIAADLASEYASRGARIGPSIQPTPPQQLQPLAIRRMIANLIDNALRHAGPDVALCVRPEADGSVIEVLDRGPGIPPDQTERLKQPFQRLNTARSDAAGAGLGLAIVERIARAQGGRFELLPRAGGGLAARVVLPGPPRISPGADRGESGETP